MRDNLDHLDHSDILPSLPIAEAMEDLNSLLGDKLLPEQVYSMTQWELSLLVDAKAHPAAVLAVFASWLIFRKWHIWTVFGPKVTKKL